MPHGKVPPLFDSSIITLSGRCPDYTKLALKEPGEIPSFRNALLTPPAPE